MSEGNDAFGGATGEMGSGAFVVSMIGGPAVSTAPVVGAVASLMSWIFAVASKTIDVRGELTLSLAK